MCLQCAVKILTILDEMEQKGDFRGLTAEQIHGERLSLGMRLRADMSCPEQDWNAADFVTPVKFQENYL